MQVPSGSTQEDPGAARSWLWGLALGPGLLRSAEDSPGEVTSCPGPRPAHVSGFIRFTSLTTRTSPTVWARPLPPSTVQSEAASGSEVKRIEECESVLTGHHGNTKETFKLLISVINNPPDSKMAAAKHRAFMRREEEKE